MIGRKLAGKLTITRPSSNHRAEVIVMVLEDGLSRTQVVEVEIDPAEFVRALTGLGARPVEFTVSAARAGMRHEWKEEVVPLANYPRRGDTDATALIAPYEVDGWIGRPDDVLNGHNQVRVKGELVGARVHFDRWVEDPAPSVLDTPEPGEGH